LVTSVDVRDRGALLVEFEDGAGLWVGPNPQFGSWHMSGQGIAPVMVGPGGENDWAR
jgi:hypothetical protein